MSESTKDRLDTREAGHGIGQRRRDAPGLQERAQAVLVLARGDRGRAREEQIVAQPVAGAAELAHVAVGGRYEEIDALGLQDVPQRVHAPGMARWRDEVVALRLRILQDELVVVAAENGERDTSRSQAADEIVARPASGIRDEHASDHDAKSRQRRPPLTRAGGGVSGEERRSLPPD